MELDDVRDTLTARLPQHRADLEALVRIPSVSADPARAGEVRRAAEAARDLLAGSGLEHAQLLEIDGAHPAVYADWLHAGAPSSREAVGHDSGAPTVLLYAHHDVQPTGDAGQWTSPPFEPTERDGRLFGRGAADDKAGILVHVAAVDAWLRARGALPVNVKVIIEGEEETGSEHLGDFLARYAELLRADVMVLTDSVNWQVGVPAITYLLRGLVDCEVEVRALDHAVHSGMYGGPVPDPVTGLVKLIAGMTDEHGAVAIPELLADVREPSPDELAALDKLDFDEARFRGEAGLLDGVALGGDPTLHPLQKLWMRPNLTVIGFDAPPVATASNTLVPSARAKISLRLAPGQDAERARDVLCAWLREHVPWGLQITVTPGAAGSPFQADPTGPVYEAAARALEAAYDHEVVFAGVGGSIPFIEPFSQAFSSDPAHPAPALLTGVEDPDTRAHGIDESLHLGDFAKACVGEAYLLAELATALR
jgi:acetylornithine deacetylase/succinyl-diaminopimelate desuccinylase-like protein